jgi:hypothetical protein
MKNVRTNPFSTSARLEEQIEASHDLSEALKALDEPFQSKFGREPGPGDPLFFEPDADVPQPPTTVRQNELIAAMLQIMLNSGIDPAFAYAFQKTGLLLTEDNVNLLTAAELARWDDAIAEFKTAKGPAKRKGK